MKLKYTYQKAGKFYIGRLADHPEFPTEANSLAQLEEYLLDIYQMIQNGELESEISEHAEMEVTT